MCITVFMVVPAYKVRYERSIIATRPASTNVQIVRVPGMARGRRCMERVDQPTHSVPSIPHNQTLRHHICRTRRV